MIAMVGDGVMTLDKAYKMTVDGLRNLGWKDLALDYEKRGINASFESRKDIWEILLSFSVEGEYEINSRSSWKIQNETSDIVQHLVQKINQSDSEHEFRMDDNGKFEVKTSAIILDKNKFMEGIRQSIISNIHAYESYVEMLKRFVNTEPEYLKNETEDFRALMDTELPLTENQVEQRISLDLQK